VCLARARFCLPVPRLRTARRGKERCSSVLGTMRSALRHMQHALVACGPGWVWSRRVLGCCVAAARRGQRLRCRRRESPCGPELTQNSSLRRTAPPFRQLLASSSVAQLAAAQEELVPSNKNSHAGHQLRHPWGPRARPPGRGPWRERNGQGGQRASAPPPCTSSSSCAPAMCPSSRLYLLS
jgi:hypothetical protein